MMDLRPQFLVAVKKVRAQRGDSELSADAVLRKRGSTKRQAVSPFEEQARLIRQHVKDVLGFVARNRKQYLNPSRHLGMGGAGAADGMSERERDQIDEEGEASVRRCYDALGELRRTGESLAKGAEPALPQQLLSHRTYVLEFLAERLQRVSAVLADQKEIRLRQALDASRLANARPRHFEAPGSAAGAAPPSSAAAASAAAATAAAVAAAAVAAESDGAEDDEDLGLSVEERQMLEEENEAIFKEMDNMQDEAKATQSKLAEIARLQDVFIGHVAEQAKVIDDVYETAIESTENVKRGNEDLTSALKHNKDFRMWILFFLVVLSFALLFLDWYN